MEGFAKISKAATADGQFSAAQKQLVATAISVVVGCEDCILYHVDAAKRLGADARRSRRSAASEAGDRPSGLTRRAAPDTNTISVGVPFRAERRKSTHRT
jgi:AhpD family alkylhydroperoxidase